MVGHSLLCIVYAQLRYPVAEGCVERCVDIDREIGAVGVQGFGKFLYRKSLYEIAFIFNPFLYIICNIGMACRQVVAADSPASASHRMSSSEAISLSMTFSTFS